MSESREDGFVCHCPEKYKGTICEIKKGPCYSDPCLNDAACVENGDEFKCVCSDEFQGKLCEKAKVVCKTRNTDILFIIDDSRSVRRSEYELMKNFIIQLTNRFNISEDQSRVALIQFSAQATTVIKFHFDEYYDKASLTSRINGLQLSDGSATNTDFALKMAREQIFNGRRGDRSDVRNVIILMTDGESHDNDAAIREAALLKTDVSIIAIGVGKGDAQDSEAENGGTFFAFLEDLSSGTDYTFGVSFARLDTIIDGVIKAACENLQDT
ncbi:matrilin-3-like [Dendronephthya gigantea]|uniref:matrilin-3-like n=1 Tax=Dendronephthya gigantea TaxID=151771 RepID=UPI00106AF459|nr:matrilin-3-like [Dendronephthya gigantea]